MKEIEFLMERIHEEIEDAHVYAEKAVLCKEKDPELAGTYLKISEEELNHMSMLHRNVIRLIAEFRREKGEPPADMMAIYEYLHKCAIRNAETVGVLQGMYRK